MIPTVLLILVTLVPVGVAAQQDRAASITSAAGKALIDRLRQGGTVMFIRHADTAGQPCDAYGSERERQRNLSVAGREQADALGRRIEALGIPVAWPVFASPVFRARDTAGVLVLEPRGPAGAEILGVAQIVPAIDGGNPACR